MVYLRAVAPSEWIRGVLSGLLHILQAVSIYTPYAHKDIRGIYMYNIIIYTRYIDISSCIIDIYRCKSSVNGIQPRFVLVFCALPRAVGDYQVWYALRTRIMLPFPVSELIHAE